MVKDSTATLELRAAVLQRIRGHLEEAQYWITAYNHLSPDEATGHTVSEQIDMWLAAIPEVASGMGSQSEQNTN